MNTAPLILITGLFLASVSRMAPFSSEMRRLRPEDSYAN
jgi:hypothetical protein